MSVSATGACNGNAPYKEKFREIKPLSVNFTYKKIIQSVTFEAMLYEESLEKEFVHISRAFELRVALYAMSQPNKNTSSFSYTKLGSRNGSRSIPPMPWMAWKAPLENSCTSTENYFSS